MNILVLGATSVMGPPLMRLASGAGHRVTGITRSPRKAAWLERHGASAVVGDVFELGGLTDAFMRVRPDAVVSLLVTLPKNGPLRASQVHPNIPLWESGVSNVLEACGRAGVRRLVAESFIFAYGYGQYGPEPLTEDAELSGGAAIGGQAEILAALRGMERLALDAKDVEGIVLRYGGFHGLGVPMTATLARALRFGMPVLPGGGHALLSFVELSDAAAGALAALERGRGGEIYNIVDDRPSEFREYATALARSVGGPPPRSLPLWLANRAAPYMTCVLNHSRVPVANAKACRELDWRPRYPTFQHALPSDTQRRTSDS